MDKLIKLLAPFGVMGIVFVVALTSARLQGLQERPHLPLQWQRLVPVA
jgi:hypothetical protein